MVLGLTGKYCSGKNMVASFFINRDWYELDVDRLGHNALLLKSEKVIDTFGAFILTADNNIDRKKLGKIVFSSKKKLLLLESIIHPEMIDQCKKEIISNSHKNILINAAILHHMKLNNLCDSVLWVESPLFVRLKRGISRDNLSFLSIIKRIYGQRKLDAKYWVEDVDIHSIQNSGTRNNLETEINSLIDKFEKRV
ncbi:MAG: dephospho-CoA kinase [Spirochaetia bacterium]|nr:dephospho-CoA kinase [Spirochaetia bacterium]